MVMRFTKSPFAFAALAVCGALSIEAHAALDYWWKAPLSGATVSGVLNSSTCWGRGTEVQRVRFYLDSTELTPDNSAGDGITCGLDTRQFANGTHQLKAVAYSSSGATYADAITINVQNAASSGLPAPTSGALDVWFKAPKNGQTVSGKLQLSTCYVAGAGVTRVDFFVDGKSIGADTAVQDGMSCVLDTTGLTNGTHQMTATATSSSGAKRSDVIAVNVQNAAPPPPDPVPNPGPDPVPSLPSTGTSAIPTFESIGVYWNPGANPGSAGCSMRYRVGTETTWKQGQPLWYDGRDGQCRGSLVHLKPGTAYEVQLALPGQTWSRALVARTWSEQFPIAKTVHVTSGSAQINITEGGTKDGYVLYTPAPGTTATRDAANGAAYNFNISAPYVIVRGLTLKGAQQHAIWLQPTAHDVVIEKNDISNWGRTRGGGLGVNMDSGIRARCDGSVKLSRVVIQNNRIHHPRYGSNSWSSGHPAGPQAIAFTQCGGNHVFRHNAIYSSSGKYFNDGIGGEENFSPVGFPAADTDIYGNSISQAYDDGIESEGGNRNVRIWGNYIDDTFIAIASTVTHTGPLYVFRNVYNRGGTFGKSGQKNGYGGGRRYFFHNTLLQASSAGPNEGIKGNTNEPMTNSVSRNNNWHVGSAGGMAIGVIGGSENSFDYDMSNGNMAPYSGAQAHGIVGTPTYASGNGPASGAGGFYQLAPGSKGYDAGHKIPNFSDGFLGNGPDMGAHETGSPAMKFGPR